MSFPPQKCQKTVLTRAKAPASVGSSSSVASSSSGPPLVVRTRHSLHVLMCWCGQMVTPRTPCTGFSVAGRCSPLHSLHGDALVVMVAAGAFHRAALTVEGAIWTCGRGDQGQLGHGDEQDRLRPTRLGPEAFGGLPVVHVHSRACVASCALHPRCNVAVTHELPLKTPSGMRAWVAVGVMFGVLGDSAVAFQCTLSPSMAASPPAVSRRHVIGACAFGALSMFPTLANAEAEKPLVPESEMIKPPANSCAQGVGGKCTELAEGCVCMNMHTHAHVHAHTWHTYGNIQLQINAQSERESSRERGREKDRKREHAREIDTCSTAHRHQQPLAEILSK